jgi:hypothetical protein
MILDEAKVGRQRSQWARQPAGRLSREAQATVADQTRECSLQIR